jgi:hypothetical protein
MSWQLFKQNILAVANRPEGIPDIDTIAKLYADEYDAAVKRGGDLLHGIPIANGNKLVMEQFFKLALQKGLTATGPYDLVGEMGNGVKAYWAAARMKTTGTRPGQPLPIVPPIPKVTAIQLNVVLNNGIWIPPIPSPTANIANTTEIGAPQTPQERQTPPSQLTEDEEDALEQEALVVDKQRTNDFEQEFNSLFDSKEDALAHNKPIPYTPDRQYQPVDEEEEDGVGFYIDGMETNSGRKIKGTPYVESANGELWTDTSNQNKSQSKGAGGGKPQKKSKGKSYTKLKEEYGEGNYPALDDGNANFTVAVREKTKTGKETGRLWYKSNPKYLKLLSYVNFPSAKGEQSFPVHRKIAAAAEKASALIRERKLQGFIFTIGGTLAIRNNTTAPFDNRSLSFHAWALAIDLNADIYPYGTRFNCEFTQVRIQGKWRDVTKNDIGFLKVAKCFIEAGFGWLGSCNQKDAMHFSIEEGGYKGNIPV